MGDPQPDNLLGALRAALGADAVLTAPTDRAGYETDLLKIRCGRALAVLRPGSTAARWQRRSA